MPLLTVEQILSAPDLQEEEVEIPEWGGSVRVRAFTKAQQQQLREQATLKANTATQKKGEIDTGYLEMLMLVHGIVEPKFETTHILALKQKAAGPIERINRVILRLSGMTEEAVQSAEATFQEEPGAAV